MRYYKSVLLDSRKDKDHEFDLMVDMINCLDGYYRSKLRLIFCDSKAGDDWVITLIHGTDAEVAFDIALVIKTVLRLKVGGWNGITIKEDGESLSSLFEADAWWEIDLVKDRPSVEVITGGGKRPYEGRR